ncbi:MAG: hypothetical protein JW785_00330 [Acidimicrobiia bacterium]|nr:hypothetical protein [Acidimicrobiia bacterium]
MKRSRIWLLLALLLAIALVTSGCFQIRMFKINKDSLAAGEMVTVRTEAFPVSMSTVDTNEGYYFLLIGYDNIDWQGSSQIDADGNWGGPYNKGNNAALVAFLLTAGNCQSIGIDAADMEASFEDWRVVVSLEEFGPEGATEAQLGLRNRTQLYFNAPATAQEDQRGDIVIFSGIWDDGLFGGIDGTPEAGETFCTGLVTFSVPYTD